MARTVQQKLDDFKSVSDYSSLANAAKAGAVYVPAGATAIPSGTPATAYSTSWIFDSYRAVPVYLAEAGETAQFSRRTQYDRMPGPHVGIMNQASALIARPVGSGTNGPTSADYGMTISMIKEGWPSSTVAGEIDGLNIVVRNSSSTGGGYNGDCAGILANVGVTGNGYAAVLESQCSVLSNTGAILHQIAAQQSVVDPVAGNYLGYYCTPSVGDGTAAFYAAASNSNSWEYLFRGDTSQGVPGRQAFNITGTGQAEFFDILGGGSRRTVRNNAGVLSVLNNARTVETLTLNDAGTLSVTGSMNTGAGGNYAIGNVQVVRAREVGYAAMTGTADKGSVFNQSTVTLQQLAARVKSLQDSLMLHGLIGV
ncbi:hypothetical protein ASF45_20545 [Pseudorhodoferax sp. Leaf265]|nr:hypothetical protein ASF45_20545 [Pseudorhodoferax sp. Leaf265]